MKRAVVIHENTLGIVLKSEPSNIYQIQVLHPNNLGYDFLYLTKDDFREATEADFEAFRVKSHPDYFREITVDNG